MARFAVSGIDTLIAGLDDMIQTFPEIRDNILDAEADVLEPAIRRAAPFRTGRLRQSIKRRHVSHSSGNEIRIGPVGEHHRYVPKHGDGKAMNRDVAFTLEYGSPRRNISARNWMSQAVEKNKAKAFDAAEKVYYNHFDKLNL